MKKWIDKAAWIIVDRYDPDEIILFGSYIQARQTLHSDIDLLIIKDTDLPRHLRGVEVAGCLAKYPVKFDLLYYTPAEFKQAKAFEYSFMNSIIETGICLYSKKRGI